MPRLPLLACCLGLAATLPGQTPALPPTPRVVAPQGDSILHQGAAVRVLVPALGRDTLAGLVGRSNSSPGCLGIAVEKQDSGGHQYFTYLKALTFLAVDQRTNKGFHSRADGQATPDDWRVVTPAEIARADSGCHRR